MLKKKGLILASAFIGTLLFCYFLLPGVVLTYVTGSDFIKKQLVKAVETAYPVRVQLGEIRYVWGRFELTDFRLTSLKGQPVAEVPVTRVDINWFNLVLNYGKPISALQKVTLVKPRLVIDEEADGSFNLQNIFASEKGGAGDWLDLVIRVVDGEVKLPREIQEIEPGSLRKIGAEIQMTRDKLLLVQLSSGTTLDQKTRLWVEGQFDGKTSGGRFLTRLQDIPLDLLEKKTAAKFNLEQYGITSLTGRGTVEAHASVAAAGKLQIENVRVLLEQAGGKWSKIAAPFTGLNGELWIAPDRVRVEGVRGYIGSGLVRLNGAIDLKNPIAQGNVSLEASGIELKAFRNVHPQVKVGNVTGETDVRLRITGDLSDPEVRGEIRLRNGSFREPGNGWHFTGLDGLARLDHLGLDIRYLNGRWQEGTWSVSGRIRGWEQPVWDLAARFRNWQPDLVDLPVTHGPVSGEINITGLLRTPAFKGAIRTDRLTWSQWEGQGLSVAGSFETATGLLTLSRIRLGVNDAQLEGDLRISTRQKEQPFTGNVKGTRIDPSALPEGVQKLVSLPQIRGTYELTLAARGKLTKKETWQVQGELRGEKGSIEEIPFRQLRAYFAWSKQRLTLEQFLVDQGSGKLLVNGTWSPVSGITGEALANNVAFSVPVAHPAIEWVKGIASGRIRLQGDKTTLSGRGWLDLDELCYANGSIGELRLRLVTRGKRLSLDRSRLNLAKGGQVQFQGAVYWGDNDPSVDITMSTDDLSLQEIESMFSFPLPIEIRGAVNAEAKITGPLFQPMIKGKMFANKTRIAGRLLDLIEADWSWKEGVFTLQDAQLQQGEGRLKIGGDVNDNQLKLSVTAEKFPVETLGLNLGGVPVQGEVGLEGTVKGSIQQPIFQGKITGDTVNLAGVIIKRVEGGFSWDNQRLTLDNVIVDRVEQLMRINGNLDFAVDPKIDLEMNLEETRLSEVLLIVGFRPKIPMDGIITGQLQIRGSVSEPQMRILANLDRGFIDGYQNLQGQLDIELHGQEIAMHRIRLTDGQGTLAVTGKYNPGKNLEMNLGVTNFTLKPLGGILNQSLQGQVDFTAEIAGTNEGLSGRLAGKIRAAKWSESDFPLTELQGEIRDGMLYAEVAQKEINLLLRGQGPINPEWIGFIKLPAYGPNQHAPINWKLTMDETSSGALGKFFPGTQLTGGTVKAAAEVVGTWKKPQLSGNLQLHQIQGKFGSLPEKFVDLNAQVLLNDNKLEVLGLTSKYGKGTIYASGEINMNGFSPGEMDLMLQARRFHYASPAFEGFIDGHLLLNGTFAKPVVSGEAVINDSRVSIVRSTGKGSNFNPELNLTARTGRDNYFRQYGVANVLAEGELQITGNMKKPILEGTLVSRRGTLSLYGNNFRVTEAKADFSQKNGYYPELKAEATTRGEKAEIFLTVSGWTGGSLDFSFRSVPEKSYEEIISMLHWSEMTDGSGGLSLIQGNMNTVIDSVFGSVLERFRTELGMDYLTLEQDVMTGPFRLNVGKSVSDDIYILYSRTLDESREDVWSLEYSLIPGISLLSDYSEEEGTRFQLNFNFNF